jgi:hypothetical protein
MNACKPFFPSWQVDETNSDAPMVACQAQQDCQEVRRDVVGEIAQVESELDRVIEQIGSRMVQAMRDGDPQGAEILRDRLYAAIGSRSPEHQQRLHAKAWQRMLDEDACYFSACGELDAERGGNV